MLTGNIPEQLCGLSSLQVLELSHNNLSGSIPTCLGNLKQMTTGGGRLDDMMLNSTLEGYLHMDLNLKGVTYDYAYRILPLVKMFDLSSNNLLGEIPEEIKNLKALGSLNLSHNHLTGKIPEGIGRLQGLETLDLSSNHLWVQFLQA
jgi:Leucine-rich repeat (LRR) protein